MKKKTLKYLSVALLFNLQFVASVHVFAEETGASTTDLKTLKSSQAQTKKTGESTSSTELASWMPDPTLQQIVAKALNIDVSELTQEKMSELTAIYIYPPDSALADLTGLEYATNLASFYMSGTNQVTDFSLLKSLPLISCNIMGKNLNDENFPDFGAAANIKGLSLNSSSVTNAVYPKLAKMTKLETINLDSNAGITIIAPLAVLPSLYRISVQFCSVNDFTVINDFPGLTNLAAFGQNVGQNDQPTTIYAKELTYDGAKEELFIPFSIMPHRLVNFDGYLPPFTTSNSASQTYFEINGVKVESSRLAITDEGLTVSMVTQEDFDNITTILYNARINNPSGTYNAPDGYSFYSISSGTYISQFNVSHQVPGAAVTVKYQDEQGSPLAEAEILNGNVSETYTSEAKEIAGYTLKEIQGTPNGTFSDTPQTVIYVYQQDPIPGAPITVNYQDEQGNSLAEAEVLNGNVGETYTSEAKEIAGYTLKEVQGTPSGTFSDTPQTINYIYTQNPAASSEPADDQSASKHDTKPSKQDPVSTTPSSADKQQSVKALPKAGENQQSSLQLVFLGCLVLIMAFGGYIFYRKKNKPMK